MREIISINIGQAGIQLSNAVWELYCIEHGIQANGVLKENLKDGDSCAFKTFFEEATNGQFVPRAMSIDLEPTVLDEVRTGPYRNLWHPDNLVSGFEDAANNYARGHFTLGKQIIDLTMDVIHKAVDSCSMLQGFIITNSIGGGTGSGFTSLILEKLAIEYTRRTKLQVVIIPSCKLSTAIVDPYNATLCMNNSTENSEICSMFDNESVYQLCQRTLDITRPSYSNINRILSQVFSSLTVSLRYESFLNADIDQLTTNLVPYPRIHFPVTNYAPIISTRRAEHEASSTREITRSLFDKGSQMICCDMSIGKYMSCCLQYRGDVSPKDVNTAIFEIKRQPDLKFVSWCPTGFKLGINSQPPIAVPSSEMAQSSRSVFMLSNSTAIGQVWNGIMNKFDLLFNKRSFVHWYVGEGMEEGEFNEARDEMNSLVQDYTEIGIDDDEEEKEEDKADDDGAKREDQQTMKSDHSHMLSGNDPDNIEIEGLEDADIDNEANEGASLDEAENTEEAEDLGEDVAEEEIMEVEEIEETEEAEDEL